MNIITRHRLRRLSLVSLLVVPCLGADQCKDVKGVKVYLSPANHGGHNIGCNGFNEDDGARASAKAAAKFLTAEGYVVKVGTGNYQANYAESNAWGADVHVPIHSNAGTWGCEKTSPAALGGTWAMYRTEGSHGHQLASEILKSVRGVSPGTNDKMVQRGDLLELKTNARSAYAEMGFHTYFWDTAWMAFDTDAAGEALAKGIHTHCLVVGCKAADAVDDGEVELELAARSARPAGAFDLSAEAPRPDVEEAIARWFAEEHPSLRDALAGVYEVDGVLVVDLHDIRRLGSGHTFFAFGIPEKLFELGGLDAMVLQIEGEAEPFCEWTESDCQVLTRAALPAR